MPDPKPLTAEEIADAHRFMGRRGENGDGPVFIRSKTDPDEWESVPAERILATIAHLQADLAAAIRERDEARRSIDLMREDENGMCEAMNALIDEHGGWDEGAGGSYADNFRRIIGNITADLAAARAERDEDIARRAVAACEEWVRFFDRMDRDLEADDPLRAERHHYHGARIQRCRDILTDAARVGITGKGGMG